MAVADERAAHHRMVLAERGQDLGIEQAADLRALGAERGAPARQDAGALARKASFA
jgi:hypothetical protein